MKTMIASLCALTLCACVFAAEEKPEQAAEMKKETGELTDALKPMSWTIGEWKVEERLKPMDFVRIKEARGTFDIRPGLLGHALLGKLKAESELGSFEAMYVITAAADQKNHFQVLWTDSLGNAIKMEDARLEGDKFTFEMMHRDGRFRFIHTKVDDDHIAFTVDYKKDGDWNRFINGSFARKEAAPQTVKFEQDNDQD